MTEYTVTRQKHTPDGSTEIEYSVEADDFHFREVGEYAVFVEFVDESGDVVDLFDAGQVPRVTRE